MEAPFFKFYFRGVANQGALYNIYFMYKSLFYFLICFYFCIYFYFYFELLRVILRSLFTLDFLFIFDYYIWLCSYLVDKVFYTV